MIWEASNLPWLALLAFTLGGTLVFAFWLHHRSGRRVEISILSALSALPLLYFAAIKSGLLLDSYIRFARPWAAPLCTLACAYLLARCVAYGAHETRLRKALRDATTTLLGWVLGLCVAGVEWGRPLDRLAVMVLLDKSRSIDLVKDAESRIEKELRVAELGMRDGDRVGVLAFGASAVVESPLREKEQKPTPQSISLGRDATDIEQAIRRALTELPSDARGKLVLISDGVATRGDVKSAVDSAIAAGVPIDVVALEQIPMPNVRVLSLGAPSFVSEGETFTLRAVVESTEETTLSVRVLLDGQLVLEQELDTPAGQDVLNVTQRADSVGLKKYELQISAKNARHDGLTDDNRRSTFVRIRGPSLALVLSDAPSTVEPLAQALRSAEIEVETRDIFHAPQDVAELSRFDLLVLTDIPAHLLSATQLSAIEAYTRHLGGGLLLMGSDRTLGPGGYGKTPVEAVSPVSFDLKQDRRRASLAEVIAIDYSGSMSADAGGRTKLDLANEAAARSAALLSQNDELGVMHVDTEVHWTRPLAAVDDQEQIAKLIRSVRPGGGGILVDPSLRAAYGALRDAKTNLKHVLLFADGADAEEMNVSFALAKDALSRGVTTSVVSLGKGSDVPRLEQLSRMGNGRFYLIEDARRLPAVFAQETILATRSALHEEDFVPIPRGSGGPLRGVDFSDMPPLRGYVVTIPKPHAQLSLEGPERDPILATWSVGLGKAATFTSDYGQRWGKNWATWPGAAQLFGQLGRSLTRDRDDRKVRMRVEASAGSLEVTADVVDDRGALDSYRDLAVHVAGPDDFLQSLPLEPLGPGRYGAHLPLERPGAYMVSAVELSTGKLLAVGGSELSTSDELRPTGTDRTTLSSIAMSSEGRVRDTLAGIFDERLGKRFAYDDVTNPLLWTSAALLLAMVAFRRLSLPTAWLERLRKRERGSSQPKRAIASALAKSLRKKRHERQARTQAALPQPSETAQTVKPAEPTWAPRPSPEPAKAAPNTEPTRKLTAAEILLARRRGRR